MSTYTTQSGDFGYLFTFQTQTGDASWEFNIVNDDAKETVWEAPVEVQNITGDTGISSTVSFTYPYLFLGNPESGWVEVYQQNTDLTFDKINRMNGAGVTNPSGFGGSIFSFVDTAVVGAPNATIGTASGAGAFFLSRSYLTGATGATGTGTWSRAGYVEGTAVSGNFGYSCAARNYIGYETLAIGAIGENAGSGKVYTYNGLSLSAFQEISPTGTSVENFGKTVAFASVDNLGYLGIGYDYGGTGAIKIYKESTPNANDYSEFQDLESPESHSGDRYAAVLSSDDDKFMIGAPNLGGSGGAYFYQFDNTLGVFILQQTVKPTELAVGDHFGKSLSFDEDYAVIASSKNSGKAYIYLKSGGSWVEDSQVSGGLTTVSGSFGGDPSGAQATVIAGTDCIIGTSGENDTYYFSTGQDTTVNYTGVTFSGSGGRLFDSDGNFLYGYGASKTYEVSGDIFTGGFYSIFVNGNLCNSRATRSAGVGETGALNSWTINGTGDLSYYQFQALGT